MSSIHTPIVLEEHGDVLLFSTIEKMQQYVEPIDVLNREYTAYDSTGVELRLSVRGIEDSLSDEVRIELAPNAPFVPEKLSQILQSFLKAIGEYPPPSSSLDELLKLTVSTVGFTNE